MSLTRTSLAALMLATLVACQSAYYGTMEKMGWHKRDLLVDRVKDARNEQEGAKEQFASALEQFSAVVAFDGGDLEREYDRLNRELERSEARAAAVTERIDEVEDVEREVTQWSTSCPPCRRWRARARETMVRRRRAA